MARLTQDEEYHIMDTCLQRAQEQLEASMGRLCRQSWGFFPPGHPSDNSFPGHMAATSDPHLPQGATPVFAGFPPPLIPFQPPPMGFFKPLDPFGFPGFPGFPGFAGDESASVSGGRRSSSHDLGSTHKEGVYDNATTLAQGWHSHDTSRSHSSSSKSYSNTSTPKCGSNVSTPKSHSNISTPKLHSDIREASVTDSSSTWQPSKAAAVSSTPQDFFSSQKNLSGFTPPEQNLYNTSGKYSGYSSPVAECTSKAGKFGSFDTQDYTDSFQPLNDFKRSHSFSFPHSDFGETQSPEEHFKKALTSSPLENFNDFPQRTNTKRSNSFSANKPVFGSAFDIPISKDNLKDTFRFFADFNSEFDKKFEELQKRTVQSNNKPTSKKPTAAQDSEWHTPQTGKAANKPTGSDCYVPAESFQGEPVKSTKPFVNASSQKSVSHPRIPVIPATEKASHSHDFTDTNSVYIKPYQTVRETKTVNESLDTSSYQEVVYVPETVKYKQEKLERQPVTTVIITPREVNQKVKQAQEYIQSQPVKKSVYQPRPNFQPLNKSETSFQSSSQKSTLCSPPAVKPDVKWLPEVHATNFQSVTDETKSTSISFASVKNSVQTCCDKPTGVSTINKPADQNAKRPKENVNTNPVPTKPVFIDDSRFNLISDQKYTTPVLRQKKEGLSNKKSKYKNRRKTIAVFSLGSAIDKSDSSTTYEDVNNTIDELLKSLTEETPTAGSQSKITYNSKQVNKSAPSLSKEPVSPLGSENSAFKPYKRPLSDYFPTRRSSLYDAHQERCFRHIESPPYDNSEDKKAQQVNVIYNSESKFESYSSSYSTVSTSVIQSTVFKSQTSDQVVTAQAVNQNPQSQPIEIRANSEVRLRPIPCFYVRGDGLSRRHSHAGCFKLADDEEEEMSGDVAVQHQQQEEAAVSEDDTLNNSPDDDYDGSISDGVDTINSSILGDEEHNSSFGDDEDMAGSDEGQAPPLPPRLRTTGVTEKRAPVLLIPPPPPPTDKPFVMCNGTDAAVSNCNNVNSGCKECNIHHINARTDMPTAYKNIADYADLDLEQDSSEGEWQGMCDVPGCRDPLCVLEAESRTLPRKVSVCPSMPAIIEDAQKDEEDEDDEDEDVGATGSTTGEGSVYSDVGTLKSSESGSLRRGELLTSPRWLDGVCMTPQPHTPTPTSTPPPTPTQSPCSTLPRSPTSLLDSMHRKFYPTQYKDRSGSTESLPSTKSDPLCDRNITHSKSANLQDLQDSMTSLSQTSISQTATSQSVISQTSITQTSKMTCKGKPTSLRHVPETSLPVFKLPSDMSKYPRSPLLGSKSPALLRATMTTKIPVTPNQNGPVDICMDSIVISPVPKLAYSIRTSPTFKMPCKPKSETEPKNQTAKTRPSPSSPKPSASSLSPSSPSKLQPPLSSRSQIPVMNRSLSAPTGSVSSPVEGLARSPTPPAEAVKRRRHPNHADSPSPQARRTVQAILNKIEKDAAETEASEACKWLRAAGFPQYAQMYEDHQFPIDITSVISDHDFLDEDSIQSLIRRLNTLNKCATMKIEAPVHRLGDESDEEEQCALSDRWQFQPNIRRWSRKDLETVTVLPPTGLPQNDNSNHVTLRSCSSHDSVITDNEESSHQDDSPEPKSHQDGKLPSPPPSPLSLGFKDGCHSGSSPSVSPEGEPPSNLHKENSWEFPWSPRLRRAASERFKGAKNFLKRMESFKGKKASTKRTRNPPAKLDISGPVVSDDVLMKERMERLGCVDISPSSESSPAAFNLYDKPPASPVSNGSHKMNGSQVGFRTGSAGSCHSPMSVSGSPDSYSSLRRPSSDLGHHKNHSSSDITEMSSRVESKSSNKPTGFPKVLSSGYVDMGHGNQVNVRTGSFSQGCERVSYSGVGHTKSDHRPHSHQTPNRPQARISPSKEENRLSFYDNVPASGAEAQQELDLILNDLIQNIQGLGKDAPNIPTHPERETSEESPVPMVMVEVVDSEKHSQRNRGSFHGPSQPAGSQSQASSQQWTPQHSRTSSQHSTRSQVSHTSKHSSISSHRHSHSNKHSIHFDEDREDQSSITGSLSNQEISDADTHGSRDEDTPEAPDSPEIRERRDSGVGSSLTRAPSDRRRHRIRWHSFVKSHRPSLNSQSLQLWNMSAGQLMVLRKLSLLKVTAIMERYSPSNRSGWNWIVPKLMRRWKVPDYKDKNVFGVPLLVIQQRTGQPLPQCMLYAMRSLRRTAKDAVGIFRKSGVRSRIQKLRNQIEADPESVDFEILQAYDVADLLKQYFRELPECLLTNKLSDTFITMFTHVPADMRLEALQAAVMLLPDENRHVLQSLLLFLSDLAQHSSENQMTASNLAVCFAPSLFHICGSNRNNPAASPKWGRKATGIPDQKELLEQKAAHECLNTMIAECKYIFMVPEDMLSKCRLSYIEQGDPVPINDLGKRRSDGKNVDYTAHIDIWIQGLLKEARDKFKGWVTISGVQNGTELAYKKVGDGHPLRLFKCCTDIEAPPVEVLNRILRERHVWDEDLLKWRIVEKLQSDVEVFQYITNSLAPHPTRDFVELRSWRTDLTKGACVLVSTSVEHDDAALIGGIRGVVLASRYLIEPCGSGKSRLTHICRIDLRGHTPEWYNKAYGHISSRYIARIRDSFQQGIIAEGPETKV